MKNVEIKAKCMDPERTDRILQANKARFIGTDHQIDTYFNVPSGRLKLREGNIEKALIAYHRADQSNAKLSDFGLYHSKDPGRLKTLLTDSLGIKVVVDKKRKIYFIDHVKFHIDEVKDLGHFVEIEVTDQADRLNVEDMNETCQFYIKLLELTEADMLSRSYSDMLLDGQVY